MPPGRKELVQAVLSSRSVPLVSLEIEPVPGTLPAEVTAFLADADARIDVYFEQRGHLRLSGFFPSDYELGYRTLHGLLRLDGEARRMCEWGSGFGVVAGLALLLGYEAHGIEIDPGLVALSRRLLEDHGLDARIQQGSFIREDYARAEQISDLETTTVLSGAEAYGEMDLGIEDFDVIFAYPWPSEEEQYCDLFLCFADYGAVLLTYSMTEGMRAYRKVSGRN